MTLTSATIVYMSIVYNWAFFEIVGGGFFSLLTTGDHVSSSLAALLPLLIAIVVGFVYGMIRVAPNEEADPSVVWQGRRRYLIRYQLPIFIFLAITDFLLSEAPTYFYYAMFFWIIWPDIFYYIAVYKRTIEIEDRELFIAVQLMPMLTVLAVAMGLEYGQKSVELDREYTHEIQSSVVNGPVTLIRSLERGFLIRADAEVLFVEASRVDAISRSLPARSTKSLLCKHANFCPKEWWRNNDK